MEKRERRGEEEESRRDRWVLPEGERRRRTEGETTCVSRCLGA